MSREFSPMFRDDPVVLTSPGHPGHVDYFQRNLILPTYRMVSLWTETQRWAPHLVVGESPR